MPPAPNTIGPFELLSPLGKGAMGEVWLAEHQSQWVQVAIKLLRGAHDDEQSAALFANEVRAVAGLQHPGVVMVLDHGRVEAHSSLARSGRFPAGTPYLVMELIRGVPLRHYCGRIAWHAAREILLQLLDALAHSHARGVIHRDIKPGNVLLRRELSLDPDAPGHRGPIDALLTDFGVAHAAAREGAPEGEIAGTPAYMAPEQLRGQVADQGPWTDLYALGCLAWELVTGEPPFGRPHDLAAATQAHTRQALPRLRPAIAVPPDLEAWLRRLLGREIADRYHHAADAAYGLLGLADDLRASWLELAFRVGGLAQVDAIDASTWRRADPPATLIGERPMHAIDRPTLTGRRLPQPGDDEPPTLIAAPHALPTLAAHPAPLPSTWRGPRPPPAPPQLLGVGLNLYGLRALPFIGREAPLDQLWAALSVVHQGGGPQVLVLRGPAGCGKTRLATTFTERAMEVGGALVVRWASPPDSRSADPIGAIAARLLRAGAPSREALPRRLASRLRALGLHGDDDLLAFTELISPDPDSPHITFRDAAERLTLLRRLLAAVAATGPSGGRPIILFLDDAHRSADAFSLARALIDDGEPAPILVLIAVTDEGLAESEDREVELARLAAAAPVSLLPLDPLSPAEHEDLVRHLLGMEGELVTRIARRTAGNPYFAVELVGDWVDRGVLEAGPAGFRLRDAVSVPLPDDVAASWRIRADRLCERLRKGEAQALEVAAVLGHDVDTAEWIDACALTGATPTPALTEHLLRQRLAHRWEEGEGWSFAHPMFREALEQQAQRGRRLARIHQAAARHLSARPHRDAETAERLGRHLLLAGWPGPAMDELLRAARLRADLCEHGAALRLLDTRERTLRRSRLPTEDELWGKGWALRCRIARRRPDWPLALQIGDRALQGAARHGWPTVEAAVLAELLPIHLAQAELDRAAPLIARLGDLARLLSDPNLLDSALLFEGRLLVERGSRGPAAALLRGALPRLQQRGAHVESADCFALLAQIARQDGRLPEALDLARQALDQSRQAGDRLGLAEGQLRLGQLHRIQHDVDAATTALLDAAARYAALRSPPPPALHFNLAMLPLQRGLYEQSGPLLHESLRAALAADDLRLSALIHAALLIPAAVEPDWETFDEHYRQVVLLLDAHPQADLDLARVARIAGDLARSQPLRARKALALAWHQWRALGRIPEAAAVQARLASLSAPAVVDGTRETQ